MNMLLKVLILVSVGNIYGNSKLSTFWNKHQVKILSTTTVAGAIVIAGLLYDKYRKQAGSVLYNLEEACRQDIRAAHEKSKKVLHRYDVKRTHPDTFTIANYNKRCYYSMIQENSVYTPSSTSDAVFNKLFSLKFSSAYTTLKDKIINYHFQQSTDDFSTTYIRKTDINLYSTSNHHLLFIYMRNIARQSIALDVIHELILVSAGKCSHYSRLTDHQEPLDIIISSIDSNNSTAATAVSDEDKQNAEALGTWLQQQEIAKDLTVKVTHVYDPNLINIEFAPTLALMYTTL